MRQLLVGLVIFLLVQYANGQMNTFTSSKGAEIGVYYYPEHWPESQWERDLKTIADLGFEFVHYAEFSWAKLQPSENAYNFKWLDKAIELAHKYDLKVIMCTPSPCVPAWLSTKHPEVLAVQEDGRRIYHNGSRLTASLANSIYQESVRNIVEQLGRRYGKDKRIWGWQIGNEPHLQTVYDYSPSAEANYITWLKEKYGTLENLNKAWGAEFWSYTVTDWNQIKAPNTSMPGPNPHALLDFQTYTSHEIAKDISDQAKQLRTIVDGQQWITTNYAYFKFLSNVDPFLTKQDLDFASHTMYLTSNWLNSSQDSLAHRLGSGMELAFSQELAESTNGMTGIMKFKPGQINWGKFNAMPLPGAVRMWLWHAFALGDEFICNYRFKQPLFGGEQTHHGVMMTDGVTLNRGGEEFVQAMNEIRSIVPELTDQEAEYIKATKTGFLFSYRNLLDMDNHKHHEDWDSWQHIYTYYQGLKRLGVSVDFLQEDHNFDPSTHPFLVVPAYQLMSKELIQKLENYANAGGHVIISTRTGIKDPNGHLWEAKLQEPIWDLIGAEIRFYDHLPSQYPGEVASFGKSYQWHVWGEVVSPKPDTQVLATYEDQFYKGKAAVSQRKITNGGSVTYVGVWSDDWEMEYEIVQRVYEDHVDEELFDLPPYVFIEHREGV